MDIIAELDKVEAQIDRAEKLQELVMHLDSDFPRMEIAAYAIKLYDHRPGGVTNKKTALATLEKHKVLSDKNFLGRALTAIDVMEAAKDRTQHALLVVERLKPDSSNTEGELKNLAATLRASAQYNSFRYIQLTNDRAKEVVSFYLNLQALEIDTTAFQQKMDTARATKRPSPEDNITNAELEAYSLECAEAGISSALKYTELVLDAVEIELGFLALYDGSSKHYQQWLPETEEGFIAKKEQILISLIQVAQDRAQEALGNARIFSHASQAAAEAGVYGSYVM